MQRIEALVRGNGQHDLPLKSTDIEEFARAERQSELQVQLEQAKRTIEEQNQLIQQNARNLEVIGKTYALLQQELQVTPEKEC